MRRLLLALILTLVLQAAARAEVLYADLSEHFVAITSDFAGAEIVVFGTVEPDPLSPEALPDLSVYDIVVVTRGPETPVTVRRKERVAGIYVNTTSLDFTQVPGLYHVSSTRPLEQAVLPRVRKRYRIGTDMVDFGDGLPGGLGGPTEAAAQAVYREAVIAEKAALDLYRVDEDGVSFRGGRMFRSTIALPNSVPDGIYRVDIYLLRDGAVVSAIAQRLVVDKKGLERFVTQMAHHSPWLYGIVMVIMALCLGWAATLFSRR